MNARPPLFLLLGLAAAAPGLRAELSLAPLFSDHAVLQQGMPVPVWGRAGPGERVTVAFAGQKVGATAGADGRWAALLAPLAASGEGAELTVAAGKDSVVRHDVLVGEVWLCSGQSNMEFPVDDSHHGQFALLNAAAEVAAANWPGIRQFEVGRAAAAAPAEQAAGAWVACSPQTVAKFTAVGYFFARDLHRRLGVPVGIIDSTWGGTPIEAWMSPDSLASDPAFAVVADRWRKSPPDYPHKASWEPAGLYNAMVNPLAPAAARGILWYQGESNANRASEYHALFAAMIGSWRAHFGRDRMPFYWVQLAAYVMPRSPDDVSWAYLREAQAQALDLPATGMAVTMDIGDPKTIHPPNKQEVGRRLALIAKARAYGITGDFSGPVFLSTEPEGAALRIRFRYADNGLTSADKPLQSFEVAGVDRKFHPALATISGDSVLARSPEVTAPVAVRYAWRDYAEANLYNGAGLPAAPFRSDPW